jgi:hypothetical protein
MRHSRHYYAKRAYKQREYNKAYNARMAVKTRQRAAPSAAQTAQRARWRAWHDEHPGERWAPGERASSIGRLITYFVMLGIVVASIVTFITFVVIGNMTHGPGPSDCQNGISTYWNGKTNADCP